MIFKTFPSKGHGESEYIWTVSKYSPEQTLIEYLVFTSERMWWITIHCREGIPNQTTEVEITYTFAGLTSIGNEINEKSLQSKYAHDLREWEEAINYYLQTGERIGYH